jgi:hypothetical protein
MSKEDNVKINNEVNSDVSFIYNFGTIKLQKLESVEGKKLLSKTGSNNLTITTELKTNLRIPKELIEVRDTLKFRKFLVENKEKLKGDIIFYINGKVDKVFPLENENKSNTKKSGSGLYNKPGTNYPKRNDCSYGGIRQCTQYSIYEQMNTVSKLFCVYAGLGCIGQQAASCVSRNCLGDVPPAEENIIFIDDKITVTEGNIFEN